MIEKLQEWAALTAHPIVALCVVGIGVVSALILGKLIGFALKRRR